MLRPLLHIFRGSGPPTRMIYGSDSNVKQLGYNTLLYIVVRQLQTTKQQAL